MSSALFCLAAKAKVAFVCLVVTVAMCSGTTARAQAPIPDTPAGEVLRRWLAVVNTGDQSRAASYVQQYQPGALADDLVALHNTTGGFDLLSIETATPLHLRFLLKQKDSAATEMGNLNLSSGKALTVEAFGLSEIPQGVAPVNVTVDAALRERVVKEISEDLGIAYIFPAIAEKMTEALKAHDRAGEYRDITDPDVFAQRLTSDLLAASHDAHLFVRFSPFKQPDAESATTEEIERDRAATLKANCEFQSVDILPNNIGYLKFNAFADSQLCGPVASTAMAFLSHTSALIIDLRDNHGGDPSMVSFIATYLFDDEIHLTDIYYRPTDETRQMWTLGSVPGQRLSKQPVYVLTSKRTFSAAEGFSYDLQTQKRATLVGETTRGGAHPRRTDTVADYFTVGVPVARPINAVTHTDWEGKGVVPDVPTDEKEALAKAEQLAAEQIQLGAKAKLAP